MQCTATGKSYAEQLAHCLSLYDEWTEKPRVDIVTDPNRLPNVCYTVPECCASCGSRLADLQFIIETMTQHGATVVQAVDLIGVRRLCCRINLITPEQQFTAQLFKNNVVYMSKILERPTIHVGTELYIDPNVYIDEDIIVPEMLDPMTTVRDIRELLTKNGV